MVLPKFHTKAKSAQSPPPKDGRAARHRSPAKGGKMAVLEADKKCAADKKSLVEERQGRTVRRRTIGKQESGGAVKATDPTKTGSATREEDTMKRGKEGSAKERNPREQEGAAKEPSDSNKKGMGAAKEVDSVKNRMGAAKEVIGLTEASARASAEVSGRAGARARANEGSAAEASTNSKRMVTKAKRTVMKAKRVSRLVARGRFARALVLRCKMLKTAGGLTAESLMRNKRGKIVSKRKSALGKRLFHHIEPWLTAVMKAREALHVNGFVAINGKSLLGKALYLKAKAIRAEQDS